ncbi:alpha/beta fold hydrolase [Mycolicibacterium farcinogenes]|uniref:Alpha/beta hydrolase n=1 Tax=Mycolicibacterium farcinogenes TaxID=1802 RepID=A0ACD1FR18_MYCFR|nr:alpha/beta hydrolase [Mycolicibacterium farcinogenes]QZH69435.1 alpha/beta hydrolase [Mycolicibacterium farcinogenes]
MSDAWNDHAAVDMLPMPHVDGTSHRYVTTRDGCEVHVAEAGAGDPLVLVHGWPQHWYAWRAVLGALAGRFRVICPDVRGLGWSAATGGDWSLRRLATDIIDVMDALGIDQAGVVGHDWGAAIAYQLGLDHPRRITKLMPLAGLHPWTAIGLHPRAIWRPWHVYTAAALGSINNTLLQVPRTSLHTWRHVGAFTPAETEIYCSSMRQPHTLTATKQYYRNVIAREVPYFWRYAKNLTLTVPVLHLNGANDPLTQRLSDAYRRYAPNMELVNLPACGHFIAEERPDELIGYLNTFFGAEH